VLEDKALCMWFIFRKQNLDVCFVVLKSMLKETFALCCIVYGFYQLCYKVHSSLFICVGSNCIDVSVLCSFILVPLCVTVSIS